MLVGSLRKGAYSRMTAHALMEVAPAALVFDVPEIGLLPLYNQDLEASPPPEWVDFRNRIRDVDALLFVMPEYNRSVPGALKNAQA